MGSVEEPGESFKIEQQDKQAVPTKQLFLFDAETPKKSQRDSEALD